jgi:glycosyltransferase involved in cell wall biosynthesis
MPRVALVTHRFPPVAELARRLPAHGWDTVVVTQAARTAHGVSPEGTAVWRFAARAAWTPYPAAPGLWRHLRRRAGEYDLVHAHNFHALPSLAAALAAPGPFVFTPHFHGLGSSWRGRLLHRPYRPAGRYVMRRATTIICVSEVEAQRVVRAFPEVAARVVVIPNGIDAAALRAAVPFPTTVPLVLTSGRLHPFKRVDRVIDAMAALPVPARLVVLGDGPSAPALRGRAARLGIADRVSFPGSVARGDVERWLRTASVYISLSESEAFGIGVAEGVAAGARVLASDIPAHRELAAVAESAVEIVPASAGPQVVASRIAGALAAPAPPPEAGDGLLGWDAVVARTAQLYTQALSR